MCCFTTAHVSPEYSRTDMTMHGQNILFLTKSAIGNQYAPAQYHSTTPLQYVQSKSKLRTSSGPYTTGASQCSLQVNSVFFGERLANTIVKLVILLCSVKGQFIRINNVHHIDLVVILGFASVEIITITGNQIHAILVALLQHSSPSALKSLVH